MGEEEQLLREDRLVLMFCNVRLSRVRYKQIGREKLKRTQTDTNTYTFLSLHNKYKHDREKK